MISVTSVYLFKGGFERIVAGQDQVKCSCADPAPCADFELRSGLGPPGGHHRRDSMFPRIEGPGGARQRVNLLMSETVAG
jgi:hypothetical protein